jgi:phenylalanyl-tRNA synthetase alpha chain
MQSVFALAPQAVDALSACGMNSLETLKNEALASIALASSSADMEDLRVGLLGKKGSITALLQTLGALSPTERKSFGAAINLLKEEITAALDARKKTLVAAEQAEKLVREQVDITLPPASLAVGSIHPLQQTLREITAFFSRLGFTVAKGQDIEDDFHNFEALNFPADHPARAMHDTFYLENGNLLRTHTSTVQVRELKKWNGQGSLRILAPGRVYRCDSDQTHAPMFHQVEGFVVEEKGRVHFGHLKGTLEGFLADFFANPDIHVVFRPSFFPFTEPSAEVDIGYQGLMLEVLGCGMIHPNVFRQCGLDPEKYQGFAFGMGVERLTMLKHGIKDLRTFFSGNLAWLKHYGAAAV